MHLLSHVRCRLGNAATEAVSALRAKSGGWFALPRDPTCRRFAGHQAVGLRLALSFCNALMVSFKTLPFAPREFAGRHAVVDAFLLFAWVDVRLVFELHAQRSNAESGDNADGAGNGQGLGEPVHVNAPNWLKERTRRDTAACNTCRPRVNPHGVCSVTSATQKPVEFVGQETAA